MAAIYELIGRLVVQLSGVRYRRQIRIAMVAAMAGMAVAAAAAIAYVAVREGESRRSDPEQPAARPGR